MTGVLVLATATEGEPIDEEVRFRERQDDARGVAALLQATPEADLPARVEEREAIATGGVAATPEARELGEEPAVASRDIGADDGLPVAPTPTATPLPLPPVLPTAEVVAAECCFIATRYGVQYEGQPLGCPGGFIPAGRPDLLYHSDDAAIMAAPPSREGDMPCGIVFRITNPRNGAQLVVYRVDSCPGCGHNHVDLSEAGMSVLCGVAYPETCDRLDGLTIERLR